jgi:hypothetical protein
VHCMQKATRREARQVNRRPKRTPEEWLTVVTRWRSSGQRAEVYARAHDLHPGTLAVWASRLKSGVDCKPSRKLSVGASASAFVPVRVSSKTMAHEVSTEMSVAGGFEVVLTNGRRVRVAGQCRPEALERRT